MIHSISKNFNSFYKHPLTKYNPRFAFFRLVKRQILKRILKKGFHFAFINSLKVFLSTKDTSLAVCYYTGLSEFEEQAFLLHFLKEDDTFIDIGANSGVYSLLASGVKKTKTIAIEPVPDSYKLLKKNVEYCNLENKIIPVNIGVADKPGNLKFTNTLGTCNHVLTNQEYYNTEYLIVPVTPLDELIKSMSLTNISLVKIDVEGFEYNILQGADTILKTSSLKAVIMEINLPALESYNCSFEDLDKLMINYGFKLHQYNPYKRLVSESSLDEIRKFSDNLIYMRDLKSIIDRVENSLPFKVLKFQI